MMPYQWHNGNPKSGHRSIPLLKLLKKACERSLCSQGLIDSLRWPQNTKWYFQRQLRLELPWMVEDFLVRFPFWSKSLILFLSTMISGRSILLDEREINPLLPRVSLNGFIWTSRSNFVARSLRLQLSNLRRQRHPSHQVKSNVAAGLFQAICIMLLNDLGAE